MTTGLPPSDLSAASTIREQGLMLAPKRTRLPSDEGKKVLWACPWKFCGPRVRQRRSPRYQYLPHSSYFAGYLCASDFHAAPRQTTVPLSSPRVQGLEPIEPGQTCAMFITLQCLQRLTAALRISVAVASPFGQRAAPNGWAAQGCSAGMATATSRLTGKRMSSYSK